MKKKGVQISVNEIVEVAFGTLLNQPSISFFNQICDDVEKIKKGDLFVVKDPKDIQKAINLGAFGILFSGEIAMEDSEVAWISVENLEESLLRILRHYLIINNKILYSLNNEEYELSHQILIPKKNFAYCEGSLVELIAFVLENGEFAYILYHNQDKIKFEKLPQFQQEIKALDTQKIPDESLPFATNSFSLFGIKIFYQSTDYSLPLPKLFIQPLARVIKFAEEHFLNVDLEKLEGISSFKPLYLDERGFISKPGATNKVVLTCVEIHLYEQFLAYFSMYAKWAKLMLFIPKIYQELFTPYAEVKTYETKEELFSLVLMQKYNFALVFGVNLEEFEERFSAKEKEQNLFDLLDETKN
ncbi:hypothetical protein [Helicobacter canadensis]|uniref:Ferrochelatase n=1 Tax=Helicobacter canadensis MIT 98-5491 TaxID=537970 RepID=C5ZV61_9HELI|nr:hypothetical protein [Helicobacter canadensis]EES89116.1 conserved hypothetical protein [Helicobacter canadensis MIT 98-5491]EFR47893.1 hypothetical protein HCMG_00066 [Helicobacter canadensis MIT 98-5491]STO99147.1 ferrochelatase [Helicobacter canadensis]